MSCPIETPPPPPRGYRLMQAMMGPMMKRLGLSCREFAELCSLRMDRPLTLPESLRYRFHAMMCGICRRLPAQFDAIRSALHSCERAETEVPIPDSLDWASLDAAARERILERLGATDIPGREEK